MLNSIQLQTLKTYIDADPVLSLVELSPDGAYLIAEELNKLATPTFVVWKSKVTLDEIQQNGFDWTQVDNLTEPKSRTWEWLFNNSDRSINPSKLNVRAGINEIWQGTAGKLAVRDQVYVHCKRSATVLEKIFATGTGTDQDPATMAVEGRIFYGEIVQARGL
jgi:hypothetical protein